MNTSRARQTVAARLNDHQRAFLSRWSPDTSCSEALRLAVDRLEELTMTPKTVGDAAIRLAAVVGDQVERRPDTVPRSVVAEDVIREAIGVLAAASAGPPAPGLLDSGARACYEAQIVDRVFDLLDSIMRHALTEEAPAWNPHVIRDRLSASRKTLVSALAATATTARPESTGDTT